MKARPSPHQEISATPSKPGHPHWHVFVNGREYMAQSYLWFGAGLHLILENGEHILEHVQSGDYARLLSLG